MLRNIIARQYHRLGNETRSMQRKFRLKKKLPSFSREISKLDPVYAQNIFSYWKNIKRISPNWHAYYFFQNGIGDARYIPEDIFYNHIEPHYNKLEFARAYGDKAMHDVFFPALSRPTLIARNLSGQCYDENFSPLTKDEAVARCLSENSLIIKPTIQSGGGRNVQIFRRGETADYDQTVRKAIERIGKDYVVQKLIIQHEHLSQIYANSINTIRTISFLRDGVVHILSSVLRIGANGIYVDNINSGGVFVGIRSDGTLKPTAYGKDGKQYHSHPQGFVFSNGAVPNYQGILDIIRREHVRFGHFKLISWDFSVDLRGEPIFIEYNLIFQGINSHQICNGPLFGDMTDEVLREVFRDKKFV